MNAAVSDLNSFAARWASYMASSLTGGMAALLIAAVLTWLLRRRLPPQVLCVLWLLVLVRVAAPFTVGIPVLDAVAVAPAAGGIVGAASAMDEEGPVAQAGVAAADIPRGGLSAAAIVLLLWAAGAGAGLARLAWIAVRTGRVIRMSRLAETNELPVDVDSIRAAMGLRPGVPVRITNHLTSPAVAGMWSPVLLVPEGLAAVLTAAQWRWTVAHELLHIRRGDLWVQTIQSLMKSVFFFHPAVWVAGRVLDARREEICDAGATALTNSAPQETAAGFVTLLEWAGHPRHASPLAILGIRSSHRHARHRLQQMLAGVKINPRRRTPWALLLLPAAALLLLLPGIRPVRAAGSASQGLTASGHDRTRVSGTGGDHAQDRIRELESRVAELEKELQGKTRRSALRENAQAAARERAARDAVAFTKDELHEMEVIYQQAKKQPAFDQVAAAMQPLFERFAGSNRAGCAALYIGRGLAGTDRQRWLEYAIANASDCLFLDGTSVGGLGRVLLAADHAAAGNTPEAARLLAEVRAGFADGIDFDGVPLTDLADTIAVRTQW